MKIYEQIVGITKMYCCVYSSRLRMLDRATIRNIYNLFKK